MRDTPPLGLNNLVNTDENSMAHYLFRIWLQFPMSESKCYTVFICNRQGTTFIPHMGVYH